MNRNANGFRERRRYVRLDAPVTVSYFAADGSKVTTTVTKNVSADGLRFETPDKDIAEGSNLEVKLSIPGAVNPVHAKANVVWKKRLSLEDGSPFDIGLEFIEIEEDNKNTFLKNLCDLMYAISNSGSKRR
jgi:c-di-GMP-binding flagellar brake protein YcgR